MPFEKRQEKHKIYGQVVSFKNYPTFIVKVGVLMLRNILTFHQRFKLFVKKIKKIF